MFNKKLLFFHQFKVLNYKPASRISNTYAAWFQDRNLVFQISSTAVANIPKESKISPNVKAHAIHTRSLVGARQEITPTPGIQT
jgi:hypothetical protein